MAFVCDRCGKGTLRGHQVSFSGKRSPKGFRPNLHFAWVVDPSTGSGPGGGRRVRRKFCTKCLRIVRGKVSKVAKVSNVSEARRTETLGSPV